MCERGSGKRRRGGGGLGLDGRGLEGRLVRCEGMSEIRFRHSAEDGRGKSDIRSSRSL